MTSIAIRADAGRSLGWGHAKRCLSLARALQDGGARVLWLARESDSDLAPMAAEAGVALRLLPPRGDDAVQTLAALGDAQPRVVVVDHYGLDARWHESVRAATSAAVVAIDDLADRPLAADLVVDPNLCDAGKYAAVLRRPAPVLQGPAHALLDPAYAGRPAVDTAVAPRSIGIFMGGGDAADHSAWAWRALRRHAGWDGPVQVVLTSTHPALAAWHRRCEDDGALTLLLDQPHLADFFGNHGLQVGAGGGAVWERCCLGTPTVAAVCADNQVDSLARLQRAGVLLAVDGRSRSEEAAHQLGAHVATLLADAAARHALAGCAREWVDGRGAWRVAAAVLALVAPTAGRR